jgi:hypothetical protein
MGVSDSLCLLQLLDADFRRYRDNVQLVLVLLLSKQV